MARVTRQDFSRFDGVEPAAGGALRVPATLTRVGVLDYTDDEGNAWGELRPRDEVMRPESLATLRGATLTDLHPPQLVTPASWKRDAIGHVGDDVTVDADYVRASVIVQDATAIDRVRGKERRELSCGYTCDLDETPGVFNGKPYTRVQRNITYNHVGLGPEGWGRAGSDVSLRMDGADVAARTTRLDAPRACVTDTTSGAASRVATNTESKTMPKIQRRDGDEPEPKDPGKDPEKKSDAEGADEMPAKKVDMISREEHEQAMQAMQAKYSAIEAALVDMTKQFSELKAMHAAEENAEVSEDDVPEAVVDSLVSKRLALREGAASVLGASVKLDGLKASEIRAKVIAHAMPTMKLDGLDAKAVTQIFDGIVEGSKSAQAKRADGKAKVARVLTPSAEQGAEAARQDGAERVDHSAKLQQKLIDSGAKPLTSNAKVP